MGKLMMFCTDESVFDPAHIASIFAQLPNATAPSENAFGELETIVSLEAAMPIVRLNEDRDCIFIGSDDSPGFEIASLINRQMARRISLADLQGRIIELDSFDSGSSIKTRLEAL